MIDHLLLDSRNLIWIGHCLFFCFSIMKVFCEIYQWCADTLSVPVPFWVRVHCMSVPHFNCSLSIDCVRCSWDLFNVLLKTLVLIMFNSYILHSQKYNGFYLTSRFLSNYHGVLSHHKYLCSQQQLGAGFWLLYPHFKTFCFNETDVYNYFTVSLICVPLTTNKDKHHLLFYCPFVLLFPKWCGVMLVQCAVNHFYHLLLAQNFGFQIWILMKFEF